MAFLHTVWQRCRVDGETVIHRDDFNLAGGEILDWMIGAMMALRHFHRLGAQREGQQLMPQTNPQKRNPALDERVQERPGPFKRGRRVAWTIGKDHTIWVQGLDRFEIGVPVHDCGAGADIGQIA